MIKLIWKIRKSNICNQLKIANQQGLNFPYVYQDYLTEEQAKENRKKLLSVFILLQYVVLKLKILHYLFHLNFLNVAIL